MRFRRGNKGDKLLPVRVDGRNEHRLENSYGSSGNVGVNQIELQGRSYNCSWIRAIVPTPYQHYGSRSGLKYVAAEACGDHHASSGTFTRNFWSFSSLGSLVQMGIHLRYFPRPWEETTCTVGFLLQRCPYQSAFKIFIAIELPEIWPGKVRNIWGEVKTEIVF